MVHVAGRVGVAALLCLSLATASSAKRASAPVVEQAEIIPTVEVVFMEPAGPPDETDLPRYTLLDDAERDAAIRAWMDNEAAELALRLYREAWLICGTAPDAIPAFHVAVMPGGNHADAGFALMGEAGPELHAGIPYVKLDERPFRYEQTLLHEMGHVVLDVLGAPSPQLPGGYVFHTTPAVTDRWTAFNEGFAIHLETVYSERASIEGRRMHYDNRSPVFGEPGRHRTAPLDDLRTLSQTRQRYTAVRDNRFAHPAAYQGGDLLRHAVDPERDLARLRNASQLLACEGFAATVFYRLVTSTGEGSTLDDLDYAPLMTALAEVFAQQRGDADHTWLIEVVAELAVAQPGARDVFLDLTRGATVSGDALGLWPELYQAALSVDVQRYAELQTQLNELYATWTAALDARELDLVDAVGPEVWACVESVVIQPQMIPDQVPLCIDLNAADLAELRALPGAEEAWVEAFVAKRAEAPYASLQDVFDRTQAQDALMAGLAPMAP
jgi:hypothetical protein